MFKKLLGFSSILVCIALVYYFSQFQMKRISPAGPEEIIAVADSVVVPEKEKTILYGMVVDSLLVVEDLIKPNQNLSEILSPYNISMSLIHELAKKSKKIFDVRHIMANKKYTLLCSPDSLSTARWFVYEPNKVEYVVFNLQDSLDVYKVTREVDTVERSAGGEITSSLYQSMLDNGASPQLVHELSEVFAWQIDFFRIQKGDKYKVIYEENTVQGESVGVGRILAAYFEQGSTDFYAIPYDQGEGEAYFDEKGNTLKKAFLKAPLKYSRISSRFTKRRFHPVQKRYKAHLGTDYAAPTGTPIMSVGDGVVVEAKYSKYNGNYVKIRHNGTYTTQYLHMSKIRSGIRTGTRVVQGQTIGYVGSTGLATGPHLCYRFWKNGKQVDALKVEIPPSDPIKSEHATAYEIVKNEMIQRLNQVNSQGPELLARQE